MQPVQYGEIQRRLQRLTRTVGQQMVALEEVVSPTIQLGEVSGIPYRSEPRRFAVSADLAASANPAVAQAGLISLIAADARGCAIIRRCTVSINIRPDVSQTIFCDLGIVTASISGVGVGQWAVIEPVVANPAGATIARIGGLITGGLANGFNALQRLNRQSWCIQTAAAYSELSNFVFDDLGILLVPAGLGAVQQVAASVQVTGTSAAGVNNLPISHSWEGEYFLEYPPR
jgi:hypothetical protein